jgi:adenine-specific DNA-methyltransferase
MEEIYRSYYTKSGPIIKYMVNMLNVETGMKLFEPCAGDGVFIDALNSKIPNLSIDICELNPIAISTLSRKYANCNNIRIIKGDALISEELYLYAHAGGIYDRIIANPPYGGWIEYPQRNYLKKLYPGLYVKDTYGIFLYRCIQLIRNKGVLVFIVPDTFLNLHMHTKLREYLLTKTKIIEICLFPSSFFPGVNFGYSNLSIITLEKSNNLNDCMKNNFIVKTGFKNVEELDSKKSTNIKEYNFLQKNIFNNVDHALFISDDSQITDLINSCQQRIRDIADCVTGFYSGNDKKYLRPITLDAKNAKKYSLLDNNLICDDFLKKTGLLNGIEGHKRYIPIVKGGGTKYYKKDIWFMDWSTDAVNNYKIDKKARFQNSEYYFKYGIGIPMVSSSKLTASLIENRIFDQSIVGVFPHNKDLLYYLLAFFNSSTCTKLIRTINPSANNSANYIKKIPIILPPDSLIIEINRIINDIIVKIKKNGTYDKNIDELLNDKFNNIYGF